jgi:hypothetical protein
MWVVKLGGSLQSGGPALRRWLSVLADAGAFRVVIVPGGGRFADAVRDAQREWRFDDAAAHAMALLAMDQYGRMLCGIEPRLHFCRDPADLPGMAASGRVPVWLPAAAIGADPTVPPGWDITSDSLALWLAGHVGADNLALVKSVRLPEYRRTPEWLGESGRVDSGFASRARVYPGRIVWWHRDDHGAALEALANGRVRGSSVLCPAPAAGTG